MTRNVEEELTEYERERLAKIERNKALMERLALAKLATDAGVGANDSGGRGGRGGRGRPKGSGGRGRGRGQEPRGPARQSSRVEKLKKEAALTAWKGCRVETSLRSHPNWEVEAEVMCLGVAEEEDRAFGGELVPRNYFIEGWVADEAYVAWTDSDGWHHVIWGEDNIKEDKRHIQTDEGGCASASSAALVILNEKVRRHMREYERNTKRRAQNAVHMLCEAEAPSWFRERPYKPTFVDRRARALWDVQNSATVMNAYNATMYSKGGGANAQQQVSIADASYSKMSYVERGRVDVLEGQVKDACVACGVSKERTTMMRLGPDKARSLCNACGLFYACMGHTDRPKGFADELNMLVEAKPIGAKVEDTRDSNNFEVKVELSVDENERVNLQWKLEEAPKLPGVAVKKEGDDDDGSDDDDDNSEDTARALKQVADVVEDYPLDAVNWDSLPHFTKLVTLAGSGCISNAQVLADEMPDEMRVKRTVPFAAHSHLERMARSGRYEKFAGNLTLTERYRPFTKEFGPEDIDGLTLFGYLNDKVQESLEAHRERRIQLASMDEGEEKRVLANEIAAEEHEGQKNFDYNVFSSIDRFQRAAERAIRNVEREQERERRAKEAEEEEIRQQAEAEFRGQFPVKKGICDMGESLGLTEEEMAKYDGLEDIPEPINVVCSGRIGVLQTMARPRCERIHDVESNTIMGPGEFERLAGCGSAKKWKSSVRMLQSDGKPGVSMGTYLIECGDEKGDSVVGRRVAIWWPTEELFFFGRIEGYNVGNGEHQVRYDDAQKEECMLFMQRVKWLDDDVPPLGNDSASTAPVLKFVRPPGVAGAKDATFRVNLGAFDVYARAKPSGTMMKNSERRKCYEILNTVRGVKDDDRMLCEPFEKLPSRQALPEYYETIKCPVDCASIERMLRKSSGGYPSVWYFLVAMELMFTNCKRFNDPEALLYKDSDVLRNVYIKAVAEKFPGQIVPPQITVYDSVDEPAWDKPADDGVLEDEADPFPVLYSPPKEKPKVTDPSRRAKPRAREDDSDSDSDRAYRPKKTLRRAPRDRRFPNDPIQATKHVLARVKGNALPPQEILDILTSKGVKDFENARRPLAAFSALLRQHPLDFIEARGGAVWELAEKEEVETESDEDDFLDHYRNASAPKPPPPLQMSKADTDLCKGVMRAIRACKTKTGRSRSVDFELLPTRKVMPEYYRAISNPIDLGSIQRCLLSGGYPTLWKFLIAIELMLSNCQAYNESKSMLYGDAEVLREVVAEAVHEKYPGHPLPKRDSVYDAKQCEDPNWKPDAKRPVLKFTMKKPVAMEIDQEPFNPPAPCKKCEMCDASRTNECFEIALKRAVHEKLPGAIVADKRSYLRSEIIEVYWAPEDTWFRAKVIKYSHARREHTVRYEADDTEETLQLWHKDSPARFPAR